MHLILKCLISRYIHLPTAHIYVLSVYWHAYHIYVNYDVSIADALKVYLLLPHPLSANGPILLSIC